MLGIILLTLLPTKELLVWPKLASIFCDINSIFAKFFPNEIKQTPDLGSKTSIFNLLISS